MKFREQIEPALPNDLEGISPAEYAAAREAQRLIARAHRRPGASSLDSDPLFSWDSLRIVFAMAGRVRLIRHDDDRNPRVGAGARAMMIAALAMLALVARLMHALLNAAL